MSRIKETFDFNSIADVVEKNYEFCHSATRVVVSLFSFFLSFFVFFHFFGLTQQTGPKRRDSSYSGGLLMSKIWWVFFRLCIWCFFPFLDFPCSFPRMTRYSKRNRGKQLTTRNYSNIFSQRVSQVFSSIDQFWEIFFSIYVGRDNFVISLPSSTAHFNWIPHEFSVLLASCLFIKLPQLLTYFLLTHSEPHTLTLSSGSFFLKTLR